LSEPLRFVARLLDGETMAVVCREFDIYVVGFTYDKNDRP